MSVFRVVPPEEIEANWARYRARQPRPPVALMPEMKNVQAVLDLGNLVHFIFRGRAYGVPPIPYKVGLQFVDVAAKLKEFQKGELTAETVADYQAVLATLPGLIWRHSRPVGRVRRFLKRLGLLRNPFEQATEAELGERLRFFERCRTRSFGPVLATPAKPRPLQPTRTA